jgi:hypothetical protein
MIDGITADIKINLLYNHVKIEDYQLEQPSIYIH